MVEHLKIVYYRDSTKGKKFLTLESYVYYIKKENQDSIRYTCKDCNGLVTIENVKKNGQLEDVAPNFSQYPEIKSEIKTKIRNFQLYRKLLMICKF
jgi:hypothetical protein